MRALVTGAEGFVGPHLVAHLTEAGDTVACVDRSQGVDICDPGSIDRAIASAEPQVIYHLAGDSDVGGSWKHPATTFRVNAEGTLNVLEAARRHGVERVLCVGSADVYGKVSPAELPLTEEAELRPTSPYAASKVAADYLAVQAFLGHGQQVVRVRAFNHLGPGQSERFVGPAIAARIARNELDGNSTVPVGNLTPRRDITDVRDVVRAYRLLMTHGHGGDVYNVCSGNSLSINDLARELVALADTPMELVADPELQRPVDIPVLIGDNTRLTQTTQWRPTFDVSTTLGDVMADIRRRLTDRT